ncbi:MAG: DUF1015 domain-containing protein [Phycisphaerales bacterium]|nr:DUF1015 domain-containing protein [Planctomycetota bacterium]MCH8508635.1 DUF1015 domain-containing protein [Phycisphaerales bacterium]
MPAVYPFQAIQYRRGHGDVSDVVAPPYDVLDAKAKQELLDRNPGNIVGIDLPCVPASRKGPQEAYDAAAKIYQDLLAQGTLTPREQPVMFAYRQTFEFAGKRHQRVGLACTVDTVPFGPRDGGGVLAHEQTFGGPKADRLALMHATRSQLSPVFGLYADKGGAGAALARRLTDARAPDMTASTGDGVAQEVWTIDDQDDIAAVQQALAGEDIFIADGHHRYNTALNYLNELNKDGSLPAGHPARRTMFILVSMDDPGLIVGPTHRVLGGMAHYTIDKFVDAAAGILSTEPIDNNPHSIEKQLERIADREDTNVFGLYDYATGLCFAGWPAVTDPLADRFADKPEAWRNLDVALVQHLIVEEICQPELNDGKPVKWAFPHTIDEMLAIGRGDMTSSSVEESGKAQLAVIVRPTPLEAVRDICLAGELMPQKSTFFYPKLITGLFLNPLA